MGEESIVSVEEGCVKVPGAMQLLSICTEPTHQCNVHTCSTKAIISTRLTFNKVCF